MSRVSEIHLLTPIADDALLVDSAVRRFYLMHCKLARKEAENQNKHDIRDTVPYAEIEKTKNKNGSEKTEKKKRTKGRPRLYKNGSVTIRMPKELAKVLSMTEMDYRRILVVAEKLDHANGNKSELTRRPISDTAVIRVPSEIESSTRHIIKAVCPQRGYTDITMLHFCINEIVEDRKDGTDT